VSKTNPLSERCTAHSKSRGGERCRKWVVGGGVCREHGASKKVKAAQQARAAVMQAELEAAKKGLPYERRHPGEVLLDAVAASDILMQHLLRRRAAGELTPEEAVAVGLAVDRAARTSKIAIDASIESRLLAFEETRLQRSAEDTAAAWTGLLLVTLRNVALAAADKLLVIDGLWDVMRRIREQDVELPRAHAEEVQEFRRELERTIAAKELEAAEVIEGDDAEEDEDLELADNVSMLWPNNPGGVA
jgi:hypothetical protein